MPADERQNQNSNRRFKPTQSFDEYRLKHGDEHRFYKSIDDPVSHRVWTRKRAQIVFAIIAFTLAVAFTFIITTQI